MSEKPKTFVCVTCGRVVPESDVEHDELTLSRVHTTCGGPVVVVTEESSVETPLPTNLEVLETLLAEQFEEAKGFKAPELPSLGKWIAAIERVVLAWGSIDKRKTSILKSLKVLSEVVAAGESSAMIRELQRDLAVLTEGIKLTSYAMEKVRDLETRSILPEGALSEKEEG